jgi:hypothetical protein
VLKQHYIRSQAMFTSCHYYWWFDGVSCTDEFWSHEHKLPVYHIYVSLQLKIFHIGKLVILANISQYGCVFVDCRILGIFYRLPCKGIRCKDAEAICLWLELQHLPFFANQNLSHWKLAVLVIPCQYYGALNDCVCFSIFISAAAQVRRWCWSCSWLQCNT